MTHEEIKAMLAEITPGEWVIEIANSDPEMDDYDPDYFEGKSYYDIVAHNMEYSLDVKVCDTGPAVEVDSSFIDEPRSKADAAFIAAAPGIIRQLLAEIEGRGMK